MIHDKEIQRIVEKRPDKSPIFYGSILYRVKVNRKFYSRKADKIVMKGSYSDIKNSDTVKKRVLFYYFGGEKTSRKKIKEFDLDKIIIDVVKVKKFLGYGIK